MNLKKLVSVLVVVLLTQSAAMAQIIDGGSSNAYGRSRLAIISDNAFATEGGSAGVSAEAWRDAPVTFWNDADSSSTLPMVIEADAVSPPDGGGFVHGYSSTEYWAAVPEGIAAAAYAQGEATDIWDFGGGTGGAGIDLEFQVDTTKTYSIGYQWDAYLDLTNAGTGTPGMHPGYPEAYGRVSYALFDEDNPTVNLLSDKGGFVNGTREFYLDSPGTELGYSGILLDWSLNLTTGKSYHFLVEAEFGSKTAGVIPEPATLLLLGLGGLALLRNRRFR